jgi:ribosomal protein S18 acetylase RimI-like enzyme
MKGASMIRPYTPADREACLAIFDSNVPRFFAPAERELFATFLDRFKATYLVLCAPDGAVIGCGGMAVRPDGRTAILRWGMIPAAQQRRGLGRALTLARLRLAVADPAVAQIILYTTGLTAGFYRTLGFADTEVLPGYYAPGLDRHTMAVTVDEDFRQHLAA